MRSMMRQDAVYESIVLPVDHCRIAGGMLQRQVVVGWQTEDAVVTVVERHQLAEETVHQMYLNRMHFILANRLHSMACKTCWCGENKWLIWSIDGATLLVIGYLNTSGDTSRSSSKTLAKCAFWKHRMWWRISVFVMYVWQMSPVLMVRN